MTTTRSVRTATQSRTLSASRIVLAVLVGLLLVFDGVGSLIASTPPRAEYAIGIIIGVFFAQIAVTAVATSMLPGRALIRIVAGGLTTLLVCVALGLHTRWARGPVPFVLAGAALCQWVIYQIPLCSFRLRGWMLNWSSEDVGQQGHEMQFGLKQIFIWTGIVAVFLAIGRLIAGLAAAESVNSIDWMLFIILALGNSVLMLPVIWGAFVRRRLWFWLLGSIGWALILSPIQLYIVSQTLPAAGSEIWIFGLINPTQFCVTLILLLAMRFHGLRLCHYGR